MESEKQILEKLQNAVGNTQYGQFLIEDAKKYLNNGLYNYEKDILDEIRGLINGWKDVHIDEGKLSEVPSEEEKIKIINKALNAIK